VDGGYPLHFIAAAVHVAGAHAHAAEREGKYLGPSGPQLGHWFVRRRRFHAGNLGPVVTSIQ
jgi:hypothetical protein